MYVKRKKPLSGHEIVKRVLRINEFIIGKVVFADKTEISNNVLYIKAPPFSPRVHKEFPLVREIAVDIIEPGQRDIQTNTIMDIIPIAAKVNGKLGEGVTNWLSGVVVFLTGVDTTGKQVAELGSSQGMLSERVQLGTPGTPGLNDIIVRVNVVIEKGTGMERRGPIAAHQICDRFIQEIREVMKALPAEAADRSEQYEHIRRPGKPRVLIAKVVSGQGAMQEKFILPYEPAGVRGGKSIVDLGNIPVVLSVTEVKDGGIHSLT